MSSVDYSWFENFMLKGHLSRWSDWPRLCSSAKIILIYSTCSRCSRVIKIQRHTQAPMKTMTFVYYMMGRCGQSFRKSLTRFSLFACQHFQRTCSQILYKLIYSCHFFFFVNLHGDTRLLQQIGVVIWDYFFCEFKILKKKRERNSKIIVETYLKLENHLTSCAVLFLLNLISGKYILRTAEDGYLTQKNISLAFLRCIGVNVDEFTVVKFYIDLYFKLINNVSM